MKHKVEIYDIGSDVKKVRIFHNKHIAEIYAAILKSVLLKRENPAAVHIEVMPV